MIVVDASALIEWLLRSSAGLRAHLRFADESLHAPHLLDVEVAHVLKRLVRQGVASTLTAESALKAFRDYQIERYDHVTLLPRVWALRSNLSAYDAVYVALAEVLEAPLVTADSKLARAAGHNARIELL